PCQRLGEPFLGGALQEAMGVEALDLVRVLRALRADGEARVGEGVRHVEHLAERAPLRRGGDADADPSLAALEHAYRIGAGETVDAGTRARRGDTLRGLRFGERHVGLVRADLEPPAT